MLVSNLVLTVPMALAAWGTPPAVAPGSDSHGEVVLIRAEKLVVRPGVEMAGASVLVHDGVIAAVGKDLEAPEGAKVVEGAVVCAGFIDPWARLGMDPLSLSEQSSSPATRSADGYNFYASPYLRADVVGAGVTALRVQAGMSARVGGLGAVVRTAAGEHAVVLDDSNVNMTVGVTRGGRALDVFDRLGEAERVASAIESGRNYAESWTEYRHELAEWQATIDAAEAELEDDFKKAKKDRDKDVEKAKKDGKEHKEKKYKEDKKPRQPKYNPDDEVMGRVANGEVPLVVEAHRATEIKKLLEVTERFDRLRLVLAGGTEALPFAEELADRGVTVLVRATPMGAYRSSEYRGADLGLAGALHDKGVKVLLGTGGEGDASSRDLPLFAALAIGYGLDREAAFHALTLGAARAFDVADRLGSVERGKDADLLVLDGDPLANGTNVQYVISGGEIVVEP